jgi:hypothetical protein
VPYASVRWPDDGRKNRNMALLKIRKTKYIVAFDGNYIQLFNL